ncbi:polyribonucleotide nucleotidyltransferase [Buchnera aphidicola]|uniref:Polyribonucleotide nucleotidyltransferase n=1 Tax=Buchnera aphidicola (Therioaphis trifolii) TaxID=1241884 RepID=A0A4D6YDU1_9GAMM|nr:polyribonucleotide nucleotidyltransferase [Buchnera aphidicola]QCI27242.1 polyribonucleotide nucleotidyltransferase [Buchnera aphidicola (Therioaphis trifolii)]
MLNSIVRKFQYGKHTITLETGMMARQATSSVMITMDDTAVFVTVVGDKKTQLNQKFFPLSINYQERTYAAGRIPGGFFRREGRPSENEILIARLIDRPIRPLFPKDFLNEIQIIATVVSVNPQINPDIVAIIGASVALKLSGMPFLGPIGAARVGYINNKYILNPTINEMKNTKLDLVVSGTKDAILMVEAEVNLLNEKEVLNAILFGYRKQQKLIENICLFAKDVKINSWNYNSKHIEDHELFNYVFEFCQSDIITSYKIVDKKIRHEKLDIIKTNLIEHLRLNNISFIESEIENILYNIERTIVRNKILYENNRIDGRKNNIVRELDIRTGILPRVHGSALFTRGETQSLVSVTLGTSRDAQNLDELLGDRTDNFLFHYNFPPYSVGEIGIVGSPKRREIGHGKLAKRSMVAVMPELDKFPYTIRIVSEITESNGSSSMASVCGASLALMDAGIPIKSAVAGVAMGLVKEGEKYIILSDILGDEDHLGDMDFKVSGTEIGITALQMDMKISGITEQILHDALNEAKKARLHILKIMKQYISTPKSHISEFAPRIHTMKINPEKIKDVIGKGGSVIRMLTEETGTIIEIQDNGIIKISASIERKAKHAIKKIKEITSEIQVGKIYNGKVIRITEFGAFVSIGFGKEGLVHISQIANKRVNKVTDYLNIEQSVLVKVLEIDRQGRLRLSIKATKQS